MTQTPTRLVFVSPCRTKTSRVIFFYAFYRVLCMNINCAKFDQNLDCTSFSRQLPYGPLFLVSHVVNGQDVTQRSLCDILERRLRRRQRSLRNPTSTRFPLHVQKQSKAIEKTTLNWDIDLILYIFMLWTSLISYIYPCSRKTKQKNSIQKEGRKQFHLENKKPVRFAPSFIGLTTNIYTLKRPSTLSFQSCLVHLTLP